MVKLLFILLFLLKRAYGAYSSLPLDPTQVVENPAVLIKMPTSGLQVGLNYNIAPTVEKSEKVEVTSTVENIEEKGYSQSGQILSGKMKIGGFSAQGYADLNSTKKYYIPNKNQNSYATEKNLEFRVHLGGVFSGTFFGFGPFLVGANGSYKSTTTSYGSAEGSNDYAEGVSENTYKVGSGVLYEIFGPFVLGGGANLVMSGGDELATLLWQESYISGSAVLKTMIFSPRIEVTYILSPEAKTASTYAQTYNSSTGVMTASGKNQNHHRKTRELIFGGEFLLTTSFLPLVNKAIVSFQQSTKTETSIDTTYGNDRVTSETKLGVGVKVSLFNAGAYLTSSSLSEEVTPSSSSNENAKRSRDSNRFEFLLTSTF